MPTADTAMPDPDCEQISPRPSQGHSPAASPVLSWEMLQTPRTWHTVHAAPRPHVPLPRWHTDLPSSSREVPESQHGWEPVAHLLNCLAPSMKNEDENRATAMF